MFAGQWSIIQAGSWRPFERARNLLSEGADALLAGEIERARGLVSAADDPRLSKWFHEHIQVPSVLYPSLGLDYKSFATPPGNEVSRSVKSATLREMWARDSYQCRYCGIPVLLQRARDRLRAGIAARLEPPLSRSERDGLGSVLNVEALPHRSLTAVECAL